MSLSGANAGYLDVRNAILRVGTLDVQTIVSGVDTATNIAKTNTILLWDDQGSDMNSPPFVLSSATRSTSPPYLELGGGFAYACIKLPNAWLGAFEVYMSDKTDGSIKLHTYTTDTTTYGDTGYELVLDNSGVTLNYDGTQVATESYTWTNDTWHQVVVGFERGAWTVSVDGIPTLINDDDEREAVYANTGQYLRLDAADASTTKRMRYVKFASNGHWLQSNTGALSYTQGNVGIGTTVTDNYKLSIDSGDSWRSLTLQNNSHALTTGDKYAGPHMLFLDGGANSFVIDYIGHGYGDSTRENSVEMRGSTSNPVNFHISPSNNKNNPEVVIDTSGRLGVGIGTEPSYLFDVGGTANTGALTTTSASITDVTHSTTKDTGALIVTQGGLGVESNIHSTNVFAASHVGVGTTATSYNLDVAGTANVGAITMNSNVYAPNLPLADTASNLVTWNSATGDFMDSGGLISNKFAVVSEQPPSALTGDTTTIQGHGKYVVTSSLEASGYQGWKCFDKLIGVNTNGWSSGAVGAYNSNGTYAGSNVIAGVSGEWVKIEFPYKTTLRHVALASRDSISYSAMPEDFSIVASNDDSTWVVLKSVDGQAWSSTDYVNFVVDASTAYKYYAIVVELTNNNFAQIGELKLFTETFSVDAGVVSTTAASGLDVGYTEHPVEPIVFDEIIGDYDSIGKIWNATVVGHGTYEITASSFYEVSAQTARAPWRLFNHKPTDSSYWQQAYGIEGQSVLYNTSSPYEYVGTQLPDTTTTDVGGTRYMGHWVQIKVPYVITLAHTDVY